jgi:hypothetical protein
MACTCPLGPASDDSDMCRECAEAIAWGLYDANLFDRSERNEALKRAGYRNLAAKDVIEAQVGIAWDLGVSLPQGHPFAPVVDGKQAA